MGAEMIKCFKNEFPFFTESIEDSSEGCKFKI